MTNFFDLLGLPQTFRVDPAQLDERFRALSQQLHPDKFAQAPAKERIQALERTAQLNQAYKALRDPTARASHLLALAGLDLDLEGAAAHQMEPAFLMEILELREELEAARERKDVDRVLAMGKQMAQREQAAQAELGQLFEAQARAPEPARLRRLADLCAALRYYRRFQDEVAEAEEEALT